MYVSLCPRFNFNQFTDFHKLLYTYYANGSHPDLVVFIFLQSWQTQELVKWEGH
jgi:hypothetical protein